MDAIVPKCLHCDSPLPDTNRGRPQRFCSDAHRKAHSRLNGQETCSDDQSPTPAFSALQPLDIVEPICPFNQEQAPTRRRSRSAKELHFEEYPPRQRKTDRCITYKLTDGKQINTGHGPEGKRNGVYRHGLFTKEALEERGFLRQLIDWLAEVGNARLVVGSHQRTSDRISNVIVSTRSVVDRVSSTARCSTLKRCLY